MRALLVFAGLLAFPAWTFFILVVEVPIVGLIVCPAGIPIVYALIVLVVSPRTAVATFLVSFGLSTLVATFATLALVGDVLDEVATPGATP